MQILLWRPHDVNRGKKVVLRFWGQSFVQCARPRANGQTAHEVRREVTLHPKTEVIRRADRLCDCRRKALGSENGKKKIGCVPPKSQTEVMVQNTQPI